MTEIFGSDTNTDIKNPLTAAYLRIEKGPAVSPPVYDFEEAGIILEGQITFEDETGRKETLRQGDKFLIRRGTNLTVSSLTYGLIFKCESQFMGQDIPITIHSSKL
ncbi:hypothetical protein N8I77_008778 [Diaporthe amygdali]|uniref:(S)-ureidoglycine aminohydrolase cupin domain-containing protein n=1 Tax=Phomopsis amygdali TaxID=1214568 RepID=A0AAD9SBB5_PHOAM|nr:hypothetical protein N8I77_008778 [Diaporthe amygdali]